MVFLFIFCPELEIFVFLAKVCIILQNVRAVILNNFFVNFFKTHNCRPMSYFFTKEVFPLATVPVRIKVPYPSSPGA